MAPLPAGIGQGGHSLFSDHHRRSSVRRQLVAGLVRQAVVCLLPHHAQVITGSRDQLLQVGVASLVEVQLMGEVPRVVEGDVPEVLPADLHALGTYRRRSASARSCCARGAARNTTTDEGQRRGCGRTWRGSTCGSSGLSSCRPSACLSRTRRRRCAQGRTAQRVAVAVEQPWQRIL